MVQVASRAATKLSCIRRIAHLLDAKGCSTLYKSQVQSLMEYCPLTWESCPRTYLNKLENVRRRAQRLIDAKERYEHQQQQHPQGRPQQQLLQSLNHRRQVSGLCVMYKIHKMGVSHLSSLKSQPSACVTHRRTRHGNERSLNVPFSRTEQHLRTFVPKYSRLWNSLLLATDLDASISMQTFKEGVHRWLQENNHP